MGNIIINNTAEGAILDIEVFGNTVQSGTSLEDIQSVGTLREDGLYEMAILSTNGKETSDPLYQYSKSLVIMPCQLEKFEDLQDKLYYDKTKKLWCINKVAKVVYEEGVLVNKQVSPETIELPLDIHIQLNSFFGDTHVVVEGTEIKPTVKAKVAKSLAASVSSVNSKSDILSDRIDNVIDKIDNIEGSNLATQEYVNQQDEITLTGAKEYTDSEIAKINNLNFQVVVELPETGDNNVIYLLSDESSPDNLYKEYIWLDGKWEVWGSASIDLAPYATKEELTSVLNSKSDVGHNHDDRYYTETEIDEKIAGFTSNVSDKVLVTDTQWELVEDVYVTNITHRLKTTDVLVEAYDGNNEAVMIGKKPIDINTVELKSEVPTNLTVYVINASIHIEAVNATIDDGRVGTDVTWSSEKIQEELDKKSTDANSTTFDNSINGMTSTTVQGAIEENNTSIKAIDAEFDKPLNTQYSTVNGVEEFECKDGYIDNVAIEGKTLVNMFGRKTTEVLSDRLTIKNSLENLFSAKTYTIFNLTNNIIRYDIGTISTSSWVSSSLINAKSSVKVTLESDRCIRAFLGLFSEGWSDSNKSQLESTCLVLEGDYTNKPVPYFEGLKSIGQGDKIEVLTKGNREIIKSFSTEITNTHGEGHWYNNNGTHLEGESTTIYDVVIEEDGFYLFENMVSTGTHVETQLLDSSTKFVLKSTDTAPKFFIKGTYCIRHKCNLGKMTVSINLVKVNEYDKKRILSTLRSLPNGIKDEIVKQGDKYYKIKRCEEYTIQPSDLKSFATGLTKCATIICSRFPNQKEFSDGNMSGFLLCNLFKQKPHVQFNVDIEGIHEQTGLDKYIYIDVLKTKLTELTEVGAKTYLTNNPITVVYELASPVIEEIPNFNPRCFDNKTTLLLNSGVIQADCNFEVTNSLRSELEVLKAKTSDLDTIYPNDIYKPTLLNGWVATNDNYPLLFVREGDIVHIMGRISSGTTTTNTIVCKIPTSCIPKVNVNTMFFVGGTGVLNGVGCVLANGNFIIASCNSNIDVYFNSSYYIK